MEKDRLDAFVNYCLVSSRSITKLKAKGMASYGLGSTHTFCIRKLYDHAEGLTRTELAGLCGIDKAQISRIIGELCEKNYVTEVKDRGGYKNKVRLTDEGKEIAVEINGIILNINNFVSGNIPYEKIEIFYEVFDQICNNLKKTEEYFKPYKTLKDFDLEKTDR